MLLLSGCTLTHLSPASQNGEARIVVPFYPLEFIAAELTEGFGQVINITPPGIEPHDVELSLHDVLVLDTATAAFYVKGFQPALDSAANQTPIVDLSPHLDLIHHSSGIDPHFWLDPVQLDLATAAMAEELQEIFPQHRGVIANNLNILRQRLQDLDEDFSQGLRGCELNIFFTGHEAFGYLSRAYGVKEKAISGVDLDTEPAPIIVEQARHDIAENGVDTIFTAPGSDKIMEVLAKDLDVNLAVLDPVEIGPSQGNYFTTMRENLAALKRGLLCL